MSTPFARVIHALRKKAEMIQIAEMECSACGTFLAHVQVVPGTVFVHGEAWCDDCYEVDEDEETE